MKTQKTFFASIIVLGFGGLFFLSGCDWWPLKKEQEQGDGSAVLLTIDGKPVLTAQEYEDQLNMARQANPQVDYLLDAMPNAEKDYVFKGVATGKLMKAWAEKEGLDKHPEIQKQRKQLHESVDLQLYMKHFDETNPTHVSDEDLKKFYDEKKDVIPGLMTSQAGVQAHYVRFSSKDKAENFLEKVKDIKSVKDFIKEAKKDDLSPVDDTIHQKSNLSEVIKNTVLNIKKFPTLKLIKTGDTSYWVLYAGGKSDAKYLELNDPRVQQGLKKMMTDEHKEKQLEQFIEKLKTELKASENTNYFEQKAEDRKKAVESKKSAVLAKHAPDSVEHKDQAVKV